MDIYSYIKKKMINIMGVFRKIPNAEPAASLVAPHPRQALLGAAESLLYIDIKKNNIIGFNI
jgi:hypothetical protein